MTNRTEKSLLLGPGRSRLDFLRGSLLAFWPGSDLRLTRGWTISGRRFLALPSTRRPSVAIPLRPRFLAVEVLTHYQRQASGWERITLGALKKLAPLGVLNLWPGQVQLSGGDQDSLRDFLSETLGQPVELTFFSSAPRSNRKPVLQLLDSSGATVGYAKVSINKLTMDLVRNESAALEMLAQVPLANLQVPRVLSFSDWREHRILVQESIVGQGLPTAKQLTAAMVELAQCTGVRRQNLLESRYLGALRQQLEQLDSERGRALLGFLNSLAERNPQEIPWGVWHGDWTPWNMTATDDKVLVWDWERFQPGVPLGFDALHYWLQFAIRRRQVSPRVAAGQLIARSAELLEPFPGSSETARLVACLYLIDIGARYDTDHQEESGGALGNLSSWLIPALVAELEPKNEARYPG